MKNRSVLLPALFLLLGVLCADSALAGANVFLYHRFDEPKYASTSIASDVFAEQLAYLQEHQFRVLSLAEIVRRLRTGEALPEKCAAISVDDSFLSFQEKAMPLLRLYQYPVTLFVNSDSVGTRDYLSWKQLRSLMLEGVEIGNHSATHDYLIELREGEALEQWRVRVREDIEKAQQLFEKHLQVSPTLFAYPYGEFSEPLMELVRELGFEAAFAQQSGVIHAGSELMTLPRFPMGGPYATLKGFVEKVRMEPLLVTREEPVEPVVATNPPTLQVQIDAGNADLNRINCFVQGDNSCRVIANKDKPGSFRVEADKPLTGRRNKYTLTAPSLDGGGWHWYSHLWIRSEIAAVPTGEY